jgi:hypothetical protein
MSPQEKIALHRRLGAGYHDAYSRYLERGRVELPEEWRISQDCVYRSPYFGGDEEANMGKWVNAPGQSMNAGATREMDLYAEKFPDWGVAEFMCWASEEGFFTRTRYAGHNRAGVKRSVWVIDFFTTNDGGQINRWDGFVDGEWDEVMEEVVGVSGPFKDFKTYWRALAALEARKTA